MKIRTLIGLATTASLVTGCSNEVDFANQYSDGMLVATVEQANPSTRVGFAETTGAFYWSTGDQLGVTTSQNKTSFSALTLKSGNGTSKGSFEGTISGTIEGYAVYPYYSTHSLSDKTLTYNFPASYTYKKVDADFFTTTQGDGNSFNPAMWGEIKEGSVSVKHLGGVFCIKIDKMPVASGTLTLIADKKINGAYTVDLSSGTPEITATATETATEKEVSITFENATVNAPGVFYVPVPVGTYNNVRVALKSGDVTKMDAAAGNYTINRTTLKKMEFNNVNLDATPEPVSSASNVETTLGTKDDVELTAEVTSTTTEIKIPATDNSTSTETEVSKSVSLSNVASGASIKVSDANTSTEDATKSVDNFTLSIPNNDAADHKPLKVEISMPNTTVTLAGNAGAAKFGEVTAETAENTLVISSGVTVEKVIVKKGNIRINEGASVDAIENSTGKTITVYVEAGAWLPENLGEGINVVDVELLDVLANGGSFTLVDDVTGDFVVSATEPVTINLGGYKITNKEGDTFTVNLGASLTIEGEGTVDNVTHGKAAIYNNGTVTLNGGSYTRSQEKGQSSTDHGGNSYYNILNHGTMTINSGVKVSQTGKYSSMIANGYKNYNSSDPRLGYVSGTNMVAPSLIINGGTFSGGLNTVKNDDGATLEIKGGEFSNVVQAIVQNHNVTTIEGGTFDGSKSTYVLDNKGHGNAAQDRGEMTIKGGKFIGTVYNHGDNPKLTITGGEFTDLNAVSLTSANSENVTVKHNADVDLSKQIVSKGNNVTLNLNGHTISNTNEIWNNQGGSWSLISVQGGKLTITGEGTMKAKENDCYPLDVRKSATLVVESGTFIGNKHAVYVGLGTAEIKGGEYSIQQTSGLSGKEYEFVLNCYDDNYKAKTANIIVTGGKFHKFNPAANGAEGAIGSTNFCADGYTATSSDNGNTWVVSLKSNK